MSVDISKMDAMELEALIMRAAQQRAELKPEVPRERPKHVYGFLYPAWYAHRDGDNSIIQFRHPGFGWMAFGISPNDRAHLLTALLHQALLEPPPTPTSSQPSQPHVAPETKK